ncbi:ArnT family glycosyltransferase [Actinophytocola sp.]|uniref:ArnT family glycosyltransferase n=1 Tax=Actinophytocola sp. TaxID=1872138 RepID=UPI00389AB8FF
MTLAAEPQAGSPPGARSARAALGRWQVWALAAICLAAGLLYVWKIGAGQWGNTYYSAAVKSMTTSFTNFLFGSFDPYGVFTVDKPPMSLWPQAISVLVFGYHGWALLLPQVIEGVAAVFLLHRTVRIWAGENAALLAAAILALTPITVAINRDNNPDTLLVLLLVAAAYALTRSVHAPTGRGRTQWLLWCAFFIGCGFLTKMMQAWIVVPGFALAYLLGTNIAMKRRLLDLTAAAGVLLASSFWWVALHDLWPGAKPYMGGSTNGTAWELIFGYNGFGRVLGGDGNINPGGGSGAGGMQLPAGVNIPEGMGGGLGAGIDSGETGLGRMFGSSVGGQIAWLLPLSLLVLAFVAVLGVHAMAHKLSGKPTERAGWYLWGSWLLVTLLVFSYAQGIWHPYYTTMLAPAIGAVCGAGLVRFWDLYRSSEGPAWALLPMAVAITAGWAFVLTSRDASYHGWTRWAVLVLAAVAVGGLALGRLSPQQRRSIGRPAAIVGLVTLLLTPAAWSLATASAANPVGAMPAAGPSAGGIGSGQGMAALAEMAGGNGAFPPSGQNTNVPGGVTPPGGAGGMPGGMGGLGGGGMPGAMTGANTSLTDEQRKILDYARKNSGSAEITLAVNSAASAVASYIINSDLTVIGMGGFMGSDNSPSTDQLAQWVREGKLKFVMGSGIGDATSGFMGRRNGMAAAQQRQKWIEQNCTAVDPTAYGGSKDNQQQTANPMMGGGETLYECHA